MTLECTGKVLTPMVASPQRVNFGRITQSMPTLNTTITLTRGDGGPIAPEVMPTRTPGLFAQVCEIEPGEHYELEVSLSPPWPNDRFRDALTLQTGVERAPEMTIQVSGTVMPRLTVSPRALTFPIKPTAADSTQSVRLQWNEGNPANILGVESTIPGADVSVKAAKGRTQTLVITVPPNSALLGGSQSVTVKTDDPEMPTISVPIRFADKSPRTANRGGTTDMRAAPAKPGGTTRTRTDRRLVR